MPVQVSAIEGTVRTELLALNTRLSRMRLAAHDTLPLNVACITCIVINELAKLPKFGGEQLDQGLKYPRDDDTHELPSTGIALCRGVGCASSQPLLH